MIEKLTALNTIEQNDAHDQVAKTAALQQEYEKSRAEFKKQLDGLQAGIDDYKKVSQLQAAAESLDAQFEEDQGASSQRLATLQTERDPGGAESGDSPAFQLYDLQQLTGHGRGGGAKGDPSLLPDGRVVSTYADNSVVYIGLGRHDQVRAGAYR